MKKNGYVRPQAGFIPIHMPKNTGAGFVLAALSAVTGFGLIWHMWLVACVSFAALLISVIVHTFNYKRDFHIPAEEVGRVEGIRTRMLLGHAEAILSPTEGTDAGGRNGAAFLHDRGASPRERHVVRVRLYLRATAWCSRAYLQRTPYWGAAMPAAPRAASCSICRWWRSTLRCCCCRLHYLRVRDVGDAAGTPAGDPVVARGHGLLGAGFIGIELTEFTHLIHEGAGPHRSAFLSSFFTLVGTHGCT